VHERSRTDAAPLPSRVPGRPYPGLRATVPSLCTGPGRVSQPHYSVPGRRGFEADAVTICVRDLIGSRRWRRVWQSPSMRGGKLPDRRRWLAAVFRPTGANLALALVLFLTPLALALVQLLHHHHLDSGAVGIVATLAVGLPALWLAVAGYWVVIRQRHGTS